MKGTHALLSILAIFATHPALASEEVAAAAAQRFAECLEAEGTTLSESEVVELRASLDGYLARFGDLDCAAEPTRCADAIRSSTCATLSDAWLGQIAPDAAPVEVPPWASNYANAVRDRVGACYQAEAGAAPGEAEAAGIEAYGQSVAVGMVTMAQQMDCGINEEAAAACTASIANQPCEVLAGELVADENGNFAGIDPACGEMLDCMQELDRMIEQEER
jgi:hypothetical protein